MASDQAGGQSLNHAWLRALRPLLWWFLVVLVILGVLGHRHAMEKTRLNYTVALASHRLPDAAITLDGQPAYSGQRLSLGKHTLTVTHPKATTFTTNFFGWYGGRNFGEINLQRTMGALNVTASPAVPTLTITGPEFSLTLHDTTGTNLPVPTDNYQIRAEFGRWSDTKDCPVTAGSAATCNFNPHLGALALTCNQSGATYQVRDDNDNKVATGNLPAMLIGLSAGNYSVIAIHHGTVLTNSAPVVVDTTNSLSLEFQYGAVALATMPTGATVADENGQRLGQTPVCLAGLPPGKRVFTIQKNGYQTIELALDIAANETNSVSTNLVSGAYLTAMKLARQQLAATNYNAAQATVKQALAADPDNADALALQREVCGQQAIQTAKIAGARNDYPAGIKALATALQALPDNDEAKALLAEFTKRDAAQREQSQQARQSVPQMALTAALSGFTFQNEGSLFETHELTTSKPFAELAPALITAFETKSPAFTVRSKKSFWPESFGLTCQQELAGGLRKIVIAGAKINDNETRVLFKVLEYTSKHDVSLSGGLSFNTSFTPLHEPEIGELTPKMKAQIEDGLRMAAERIQGVIGQTP